jgi:pimeloyl-ACP methyl ester carboxylesterase
MAVIEEKSPLAREYRLETVIGGSDVRLPHNAAFPDDETQVHVFSSPWWADFIAFQPEPALGALHAPTLLLIGEEDPFVPLDRYLAAARRELGAARTRDAVVCLLPGRTRQAFSDTTVAVIADWLADRFAGRGGAGPAPPKVCLPDPKGSP